MEEQLTAAPRPRGLRGLHYRLYDWVLRWSAHPHAPTALFVMALAEASFFPVPPDVLLISMSLARPRLAALRFAAIATVGSVVGGLIGYGIGWGLWQAIGPFCFEHLGFLGFTPEKFEWVQIKYQQNAFLALFTAGFTPIPYKVFTIAAGVFDVALPVFIVASVLGRAGRFFLVGALAGWGGAAVKPFIEKYLGWLTLAFVALLILGFWAIGALGSH
jgi:membrane protein YqaA with SNARE-associated domain